VAHSREREWRRELGVSAGRYVLPCGKLLQRRAAPVRLRHVAAPAIDIVVSEGNVHELANRR